MNDEELLAELLKIIRVCIPETELTQLKPEMVISLELGADSMNLVMIMTKIESRFHIRIPESQWSKLVTIQDVMDAIRKAQEGNR